MYDVVKDKLLSTIIINLHETQNGLPMGQGIFNYSSSWHQDSIIYGNPDYIQGAPQDFYNQGSSSSMFLDGHHLFLGENINAFINESRKRMDAQDIRMSIMETKFTKLDVILKTLENQTGQLALEMNEIPSRPLP